MHLEPTILIEKGLPFLVLAGAVLCLFWFLALRRQLKKLSHSLALQQGRVEQMEGQIRMSAVRTAGEPNSAAQMDSINRYKVLYLHTLGRSAGEIAQEAGIRSAEVDFIIKVDEHQRSLSEGAGP